MYHKRYRDIGYTTSDLFVLNPKPQLFYLAMIILFAHGCDVAVERLYHI